MRAMDVELHKISNLRYTLLHGESKAFGKSYSFAVHGLQKGELLYAQKQEES